MPNLLTLTFPHTLNVSVQPTDIMYTSLAINTQSGINHPTANADTKPFAIGEVTKVLFDDRQVIIDRDLYESVWNLPTDTPPGMGFTLTNQHYLFFSKDRRTNMSGILGYYSLVEYRNYSSKEAEIFATSSEFSSSSK